MSKTPETKPKQAKNKKYMLARYGRMSMLGFFEHNEANVPKVNTRIVVKTDKGLQLGQIVGPLSCYRSGHLKLSENEVREYFSDSQIDLPISKGGKFVRYATKADTSEQEHLQKIAKDEIACCQRLIEEMDLPMKVVDAEHILGGERIIFYFMSDGRVDFRDLVKRLAHEYQTRIEMRQIGSRDEAKLLGDIESCGQECCCKRFLRMLKPVNMRMAKMQKATLDPAKISGYCGRLKCCLRYEDKTYTELKKRLPRKNTRVRTEYGEGRVVSTQILTQLAIVEQDSGGRIAVCVDELDILGSGRPASEKAEGRKEETIAGNDESVPREEKGQRSRGGRGRREGRGREAGKNNRDAAGSGGKRDSRRHQRRSGENGDKQGGAAPEQNGREESNQ
ncbi:MAG: hypothetical protein JW720_15795 [Sedimentisphaerales bacterium]|nr:hypothetical protein [Sedimentisphaerales bacterium]